MNLFIKLSKLEKFIKITKPRDIKTRKPRTKQNNMNSKLVTRGETGLLQRNIRNLKGLLNTEINRCEDGISHFRLKYSEDYINATITKVEYAHNILHNFSRCSQLVLTLRYPWKN